MLPAIESSIEFEMSLLLFVALLGYYLASRINQSVVVGEIILGLIIGPSVLNIITYTSYVEGLARVGAVVLLFVVGLQFRFESVYKVRYFVIALAGVILPWIGGFALAQYYLFDFRTSVFVGTALTATSIAITANVLKEMGKLKSEAAEAIIGAAVIDDVLGLIALAVSNQVVHGEVSILADALILLKAALFIALGALIGQKVIRPYIQSMDEGKLARMYPEMAFIFAMAVAFLYSMLAESVGLSSIVGAFLAGASLSGLELRHCRDFREGSEYLYMIFASIFFVSLGILVDIHQVPLGAVGFILALTVVAFLTKFLGCYAASRVQGISGHDSLVIGVGMSPRGEVAMIVALIGLTSKIITQEVYVTIIFMSLITTVITPVILKNWLYSKRAAHV
jgi:Kef-type K+ transport system membrane component KefB